MSTVNAKNFQVGNSGTASQNLTWYQPSTPDGTVRLGVGNAGATSSDAVVVSSAGITQEGGYPSFACRAWVNFNGTGTVAIRASGNVSSITDNGTGDYTVNFTSALPDGNYSVTIGTLNSVSNTNATNNLNVVSPTASAMRMQHIENGATTDTTYIMLAFHR
jgi:hypothetical protein